MNLYEKPCKEIFKLKRMLEKEGIPFEFIKNFGYDEALVQKFPNVLEHFQICYPEQGDNIRISVIEGCRNIWTRTR